MHRNDFRKLAGMVRLALSRNMRMEDLRNGIVEGDGRVADVARILSGPSVLDLMLIWHIARLTIYQIFESSSDVLLSVSK